MHRVRQNSDSDSSSSDSDEEDNNAAGQQNRGGQMPPGNQAMMMQGQNMMGGDITKMWNPNLDKQWAWCDKAAPLAVLRLDAVTRAQRSRVDHIWAVGCRNPAQILARFCCDTRTHTD